MSVSVRTDGLLPALVHMVNRLSAIPDIFIERFLHLGSFTENLMMASSLEGNFSLTGCFSFLFIPFVRLVLIILRAKCAFKFSVLYTGKILKKLHILVDNLFE